MPRLNQIIALAQGRKARSTSELTETYHKCQQAALFAGQVKTYRPKNEDGDMYPGEEKRLQLRSEELLAHVAEVMSGAMDIVATQDFANCTAEGNVVVDGTALLEGVPPTLLCFLERELVNLRTQLSKLPLLDPAKEWNYSDTTRSYRSKPIERAKTKKVPKFTTTAPATPEHPAQVDKDFEDIVEGYWTTVDFSGAVSAQRKEELVARVGQLIEAVRSAREEANCMEVTLREVGRTLFDFILGINA